MQIYVRVCVSVCVSKNHAKYFSENNSNQE